MKTILKVVLVLVLLLVIVVATVPLWISPVAKKAVETGGTEAMGVKTTLAELDIGLFSGTCDLAGLNIANPEGFETPHFMDLGSGAVAVDIQTLQNDVVEIPKFELTGLDMNLEKGSGQANYEKIMENLQKLSTGEEQPTEEKEPGKKFVIKEIVIKDVKVTAKMVGVTVPMKIDEMRLENVGSEGEGVDMKKLIALIVSGVLKGVAEEGAGVLPEGISKGLADGLEGLKGLGEHGEAAAKLIEDAGVDSTEEIDKAGDKVKDLFGK
jgi:hypothetical protein